MPKLHTAPKGRLLSLDYLRGFFIVVIIIDHLNRWPSILEIVTGRGELWVSAAEGFVMISGLLLGYVRGFKQREQPFKKVSFVILRRALLLYVWGVFGTIVLTIISWYSHFKSPIAYVDIDPSNWTNLVSRAMTLDYTYVMIHFLYLYAIFLLASPLIILLLRRKMWLVVFIGSIVTWLVGIQLGIEFLQWQILFFAPVVAGFYLEKIQHYVAHLQQRTRRVAGYSIVSFTIITSLISGFNLLPAADFLFGRSPLGVGRIILAIVWFIGFLLIFNKFLPWLKRYLGWLLEPLGTRSLTAYILHIIPLILCSILFIESDNIWLNSALGIVCILITWALVKTPAVQKIIPR
mgnify:CR=1 FL=1